MRTDKQIKESTDSRGGVSHSPGCGYPSEPCNCEVDNKKLRRTEHKQWCDARNSTGPCSCGL